MKKKHYDIGRLDILVLLDGGLMTVYTIAMYTSHPTIIIETPIMPNVSIAATQ